MAMHRVGLIVPSSNTTMETELPWRCASASGTNRRTASPSTLHVLRMQHVTPEALLAMNAQTERATAELADMRLNVVATACLVAIMAQGPKHHCVVQAEIESILEREHAPATVVSRRARSWMHFMPSAPERSGWSLLI